VIIARTALYMAVAPVQKAATRQTGVAQAGRFVPQTVWCRIWSMAVKAEELRKLDAYFKKVFTTPGLQVKARPRKDDSAELYKDDEFLGVIYRDDEDGELSYNFSMAILDIDLDL
jgi:hypothetical protein